MAQDFNLLPLTGLETGDIERYRKDSGLPAGNRRLMYFYLTGLIAEREKLRNEYRTTSIPVRKIDPATGKIIEGILHNGKAHDPDPKMRHSFIAANQSERPEPPTRAQMQSAVIAAARKGQPEGIPSIAAWRKETERQEKEHRRLTHLAEMANLRFTPQDVKSAYEVLEEQSQAIAAKRMKKRARTAMVLQSFGNEFFGSDTDALEVAMCYVLAPAIIRKDLEENNRGRATRAFAYDPKLAVIVNQVKKAEKDPEFINSPQCTRETRAVMVLSTYDLLTNQLRNRTDIAALGAGERAHTAKLCLAVERTENKDHPEMWRHIQGEARRVRRMIHEDLFTPRELRRELGIP